MDQNNEELFIEELATMLHDMEEEGFIQLIPTDDNTDYHVVMTPLGNLMSELEEEI